MLMDSFFPAALERKKSPSLQSERVDGWTGTEMAGGLGQYEGPRTGREGSPDWACGGRCVGGTLGCLRPFNVPLCLRRA